MKHSTDTIAAIATPLGEGGLSVLRVSGSQAIGLCDTRFRGKSLLVAAQTHTAHYGHLVNSSGSKIDEVVATIFRSPKSYTAEDVVEISCHGGGWIARSILEILINAGARLARPGEFTQRAFLNGRIDLAQAEAVADLISSRSMWDQRQSIEQLGGSISHTIHDLRARILHICGLVELGLDFAEEGVEIVDKNKLVLELEEISVRMKSMIESFSNTRLHRDGVKTVIVGRPNVGKSSLLNALIGRNRAIVTEFAGTTRDLITEEVEINGVRFQITDTAGLRDSVDIVESEGIRRTNHELSVADLILFVFDASIGLQRDELDVLGELDRASNSRPHGIVSIANKADLLQTVSSVNSEPLPSLMVSAITGYGISDLKQTLFNQVVGLGRRAPESTLQVTNLRHATALCSSRECILQATRSLESGLSEEAIAIDLREAYKHLGEIIGIISSDDIINGIFSNFCIGK